MFDQAFHQIEGTAKLCRFEVEGTDDFRAHQVDALGVRRPAALDTKRINKLGADDAVFAPIGTERFVGWRPFGVSQRAKLTFRGGGDELLFRVGRLQVVGHIEP